MSTPADTLNRAIITYGRTDPAEAHIHVVIPDLVDRSDLQLTGKIHGPHCAYAHTLPHRVPLTAAPTHGELAAKAVVPDPCFWTPELPQLYNVELELRRGNETLTHVERPFGIRRLASKDRRLFFEGRPWRLRAVAADELAPTELSNWRKAATAMFLENPDDSLCREASRLGVMLVASISVAKESLAGEVHRLARWPAVAMVVLDVDAPLDADVARLESNLLLACRLPAEGMAVPRWARVAVCENDDAGRIAKGAGQLSSPTVAKRRAGKQPSLAAARAACDRLQADLAGRGDFCGYLV